VNSSGNTHELIIIGAGAMGSAAAYHAARAGLNPLLLEQFEVGHKLGSSHGGSRITRYANPDVEECRVIPQTFEMWRQLEKESGEQLLEITGSLIVGPDDEDFLVSTRAALDANGFAYRHLQGQDIPAEFPQFALPDNWVGLYQADVGKLDADRCVRAMIDQALARGAHLRENCPVEQIIPAQAGVTVVLAGGERLAARRLIVTAGPWAGQFLEPLLEKPLDLRVTRQQVAYFPIEQPELYDPQICPVYIFAAEPNLYGFPVLEYPGHIKIALENESAITDPNHPREIMDDNAEALCAAVAKHFNGVVPEPVRIDSCLYTETPGRQFIVDLWTVTQIIRTLASPPVLAGVASSSRLRSAGRCLPWWGKPGNTNKIIS
jgi:sarcosine oxidase